MTAHDHCMTSCQYYVRTRTCVRISSDRFTIRSLLRIGSCDRWFPRWGEAWEVCLDAEARFDVRTYVRSVIACMYVRTIDGRMGTACTYVCTYTHARTHLRTVVRTVAATLMCDLITYELCMCVLLPLMLAHWRICVYVPLSHYDARGGASLIVDRKFIEKAGAERRHSQTLHDSTLRKLRYPSDS